METLDLPSPQGPTIILGSATYFDLIEPARSVPTLEDIAYGLAFESRFSGQCVHRRTGKRVFYGVGQHSLVMSYMVEPRLAYDALMHELPEMPCGDASKPLKDLCPDYKAVERRCGEALALRFRVPMLDPLAIKVADLRMLATERRDLLNWHGEKWGIDGLTEPYRFEIEPMDMYLVAEAFMARFRELAPPEIRDMP